MPFWIGVLAARPLTSLLTLFPGGSALATAIHLADAIPDRDRDREAGVKTLAVALAKPRAELAAAGLLLTGALVSIVLLLRHGHPSIAALFVVVVLASSMVVALTFRADP